MEPQQGGNSSLVCWPVSQSGVRAAARVAGNSPALGVCCLVLFSLGCVAPATDDLVDILNTEQSVPCHVTLSALELASVAPTTGCVTFGNSNSSAALSAVTTLSTGLLTGAQTARDSGTLGLA